MADPLEGDARVKITAGSGIVKTAGGGIDIIAQAVALVEEVVGPGIEVQPVFFQPVLFPAQAPAQ